jgi:hypothetical protein
MADERAQTQEDKAAMDREAAAGESPGAPAEQQPPRETS